MIMPTYITRSMAKTMQIGTIKSFQFHSFLRGCVGAFRTESLLGTSGFRGAPHGEKDPFQGAIG